MIHLAVLGLLIVLISFAQKEGATNKVYSDKNTVSAISSIDSQIANIAKIKKYITDIEKVDLDNSEAITNLQAIVATDKVPIITSGVVSNVQAISTKLSALQKDSIGITTEIKQFKNTLTKLDAYSTKLENIKDQLKQIPG